MKKRFEKFILSALILLICSLQFSSYALTIKDPNNDTGKKGSENIMNIPDSVLKYNGDYYFKIDNLNISIYNSAKDFSTSINELYLTDDALKTSTYKDMFFIENKLIVIYEILNQKLIPYDIKIDSSKKNNFKDSFIQSSAPGKTPKKLFDSRGNLIFFYDISDIKNIKLDKKLYIHGDYETTVQKDNTLYILTSLYPKEDNDLLNNNTPDLTDIMNIGNSKSKRVHNLSKVDLINQNFKTISSIKCDSIMEYLTNDSLYFINLTNTKSTIYRLSLTSDKLKYINEFSVDGYLTNPKFINEYNKKLTFIYQSAENYKNYNIVLLDENLNLIKEIENINNSRPLTSAQFHKNSVKILLDNNHSKIVDFSTPSKPKISEIDDNIT